jgi:hypothetical protein
MSGVKYSRAMSDSQIEEKARRLGMKFPEEVNVINNKDVK